MSLKLYDLTGADPKVRFSPFCWRVRLALAHKGLGVETIPWHLTEKDKIAFTGQGEVPVLLDGSHFVHDSWKIANYLDEKYPAVPLFPDPARKGEVYFIKCWTEEVLHMAIRRIILLDIYYLLTPADKAYFRQSRELRYGMPLEQFVADKEANIAELRRLVRPIRTTLMEFPFVGGAKPSFADYIVFGAFQWARKASTVPLLEAGDPILDWFEKLRAMYKDSIGLI